MLRQASPELTATGLSAVTRRPVASPTAERRYDWPRFMTNGARPAMVTVVLSSVAYTETCEAWPMELG